MSENLINDLSDKLDDAKIKVIFGLQPYHILHIEKEFERWNNMPPLVSFPDHKPNPKFMRYVWDKLGKELGWEPFTLALYYFEYLEDQQELADEKQ